MLQDLSTRTRSSISVLAALADAKIMRGELESGLAVLERLSADSFARTSSSNQLARASSLSASNKSDLWTKIASRKNKVLADGSNLDSQDKDDLPFSIGALRRAQLVYAELVKEGYLDLRLRLYTAFVMKYLGDLPLFENLLQHPDVNDLFYLRYVADAQQYDLFDYKSRCWFQLSFLKWLTSNPQETDMNKLKIQYFSSLLACGNANQPKQHHVSFETFVHDDTLIDTFLADINKEMTQWRIFRGHLLIKHGKMKAAYADLEQASGSHCVKNLEFCRLLGIAHISIAKLELEKALNHYESMLSSSALDLYKNCTDSEVPLMDSEILLMSAKVGRAICLSLSGKSREHRDELLQVLALNTQLFDPYYLHLLLQLFENKLDGTKETLNVLHKLDDGKVYCYHYTMKAIITERVLKENSEIVLLKDDPMYIDRILDLVYNKSGDNASLIWMAILDLILDSQFSGALNILEHVIHCQSSENKSIQHEDFHFDRFLQHCKSVNNEVLSLEFSKDFSDNEIRAIFHLRRGKWLENNFKLTFQAFTEYSTCLELLSLSNMKYAINVRRKALFKRSRLFLQKGNLSDAIRDLQSCIDLVNLLLQTVPSRNDGAKLKLNKTLQKSHFNLGFMYYCVEQYEQAEMSFAISAGRDAYVSRSNAYLGLILSKQSPPRLAEAINSLKRSLKNPEELGAEERDVRMTLAGLLFQQGRDHDTAIQQYSSVLNSHPTDLVARSLRANSYFLTRMFENALDDYSECLKLCGESHGSLPLELNSLRYCRGCCFQKLGNFSDAKKDFEMIYSAKKADPDYLQSLAAVYEACGMVETAVETYSSLIELLKKDGRKEDYIRVLKHRATLCSICDLETQAITDLSTIIALVPDDSESRYERGSLIKATYLDLPEAREASDLSQLRIAMNDLECIKPGHPLHVKARIKLRAICTALNISIGEEFKEELASLEKNRIDGVDPDYVMDYVLKMSREIQQDAANGLRKFSVKLIKSVINHETRIENLRQVDIIANLDRTYSISEHRRIIFGNIKSKFCTLEREPSQKEHYPFKMRFKISGDLQEMFFICTDQESRDLIFRTHHRISNFSEASSMYKTPIHLMKELVLRHSNDVNYQYQLARLQEEDGDFDPSIKSYLTSLRIVSPASLEKGSISNEFQGYHQRLRAFIPELSLAMLLPWNGNSNANRIKSKVLYRLGSIEIKRSTSSNTISTLNEYAKNILEVSILLDRNSVQPNILIGKHCMQESKFETAIQYFQNVVRINKEMPEAYNNLGVALDSVGRESEALAAFSRALEDKPDFCVAECNIIMIKLRQEISRPEATSIVNRLNVLIDSKSMNSSSIFALRGLCKRKLMTFILDDVEAKTKLVREMRKDFKTALQIDPRRQQARLGLILSYLEEFEVQSALDLLASFQDTAAEAGSRKELIVTALKLKSYFVKPVATFLRALSLNPQVDANSVLQPRVEVQDLGILDHYLLSFMQNSAFSVHMTHVALQKLKKRIQVVVYGFEQGLWPKVIKSLNKLLTMSHCNDRLKVFCLMKRTLAHERVGNIRKAADDALLALNTLGMDLRTQQEKLEILPQYQENLSSTLLYAFLCYTGNLHESNGIQNEKLAKQIYRSAILLIPDKVLAHLNLGNLYRKRLKFIPCMQSYINAMKCCVIDCRKTESELIIHQEQIYSFCTKYFMSLLGRMKVRSRQSEKRVTFALQGHSVPEAMDLSSLEGNLLLIEQRIDRIRAPSRRVRLSLKRASRCLLQNGDSLLTELHSNGLTSKEIMESSIRFEDFYLSFNTFSDVLESTMNGM
eukprot:765782-Hanusia_phi.AAC.8